MYLQAPRQADTSEIPIVSLAGATTSHDALSAAARQIGQAAQEAGFFYIADHGVSGVLVRRMFEEADRFSRLPLDRKMSILFTNSPNYRGYLPTKTKGYDRTRKGNLIEAFQIMRELGDDDPDVKAGKPLHGPNQWPDGLPGFRAVVEEYQQAMHDLSDTLLRAFALSLGAPEDFFTSKFRKPLTLLRLAHYPPPDGPPTEEEIGLSAHRDKGAFTILAQDMNGGLEIQTRKGEWVGARPIAGTFVINIGDAMAQWTNDRFTSTLHRVVNYSGRDRYSIPFFANMDYDVVATCLPACQSPANPPRYAPVHCGEFIVKHYASIWPTPAASAGR